MAPWSAIRLKMSNGGWVSRWVRLEMAKPRYSLLDDSYGNRTKLHCAFWYNSVRQHFEYYFNNSEFLATDDSERLKTWLYIMWRIRAHTHVRTHIRMHACMHARTKTSSHKLWWTYHLFDLPVSGRCRIYRYIYWTSKYIRREALKIEKLISGQSKSSSSFAKIIALDRYTCILPQSKL